MHKARQAIASSYAKRIRQTVEEELKNPGYLEKIKTLPHSKEATNVTALLFTKMLLMGMNHALGQKKKGHKFADGVDEQAQAVQDVEVLPFEEAVEYMQGRLPLDAKEYYKLADKARFRAFTVSLLADGDLLKKAKDMLAKNLEEGGGLKDFLVKTDTDLLKGVGMAGTGGGWYWETVYRTGVQTAYNVGRAIGFESVPPVALELVGIGDARQTELCKSLTQPPVRRLYGDEFWKKFWPPLHFNCRTTVRAIYDEEELEEQPITGIPADAEKHKSQGWGSYPLDNDRWWEELPSMKKRARAYGVQGMIEAARGRLIEKNKTQLITPESIEIPPAKLTEYALNPEHIDGKHKAKVFESALGYTLDNYQDLIDNVYKNINNFPVVQIGNNEQGKLYRCDITITGPNGRTAVVRTGWIMKKETDFYRLTTIFVL